jgi:lipoprotein-releasing system ATP-binding protein
LGFFTNFGLNSKKKIREYSPNPRHPRSNGIQNHPMQSILRSILKILIQKIERRVKTMIEARQLEKFYGKSQVLKGVDLTIEKGEFVSIIGRSGAGKSTLLHILGTLDVPDKGTVSINGQQVSGLNTQALARFRNQNIGFVFQFHHLLPEFTALENVCMPAYINKKSDSSVTKRAMELLDYLGLAARTTHKPGQLSGGEQQRVAVARALMNRPAVVFADEPSGNLDSVLSKELHELLFQLRNDFQQTFVIVTHNLELAAMSDRCLEMNDGLFVPKSL